MLVILLSLSMTLFLRFSKEREELLILKWLLDETRSVAIELLSAPRNEKFSQQMTNFYF